METIKCPECGSIVKQSDSICPNCGYPLKNENNSSINEDQSNYTAQDPSEEQYDNQNQSSASAQLSQDNQQAADDIQKDQTIKTEEGTEKTSKKTKIIRNCLIAGMIIFALFAAIFFGRAHYVRTVYDNSGYYTKNVYVGGDAYNFIINGTYFTGYSTTASSCMVCALICGVGVAAIEIKKK